jgi:hypothetical protein
MVPEQEFKKLIREYLSGDIPDDARQLIEQLEMDLASPGDWESAKYQALSDSGTAETSE